MPSDHDIYLFLNSLFEAAQLTADCAIITLIYVERMLINTDIAIQAGNWARVILGGLVLASKVWDDQAVWNVDFCTIFPDVRVRDMNILERFYINAIHYNVSIKASLFAKYYFDLRDLATQKQLTWSLKPLTVRQATRLEAITSAGQSRLMDATGSFASVQIIQTNRNTNNVRDFNDNENYSQSSSKPRAENSASEYSLYQSKSTLNQNSKSPQVKPDVAAPASLNQSDESGSSPRPPGSSSSSKKEKLDPKSLRMPNTGLKVVVNVGSLRRAMSDHIFEPPSPAVIM
ncbi:hypothetical protein BKA69DRAFT_224340 [Paraphysoderma sedebokerense]|nr:hypothetical protein BKA69DRAFT_224340 [Paraphysoderma sedebokerense]